MIVIAKNIKYNSPVFDGVIYRMSRIVGEQHYGIEVAVPLIEMLGHRNVVARRLMRARHELALAINKIRTPRGAGAGK